MTSADYSQVVRLVQNAREIIFDRELAHQVTKKGLADYVTQVDFAVQDYLRRELYSRWPQIDLMAEEQKDRPPVEGRQVWILDPIDGTTNLIRGYQHSAVSLALWDRDHLAFGVVYNPFSEETFTAARGEGAFLNGQPIQVGDAASIDQCLVTVGTCPYRKSSAAVNFPLFQQVFLESLDLRRSGSAALDLAYLACGRIDCYFELDLKPWDYAAGTLLVQEAGGRVTGWRGETPNLARNCDLLATNGPVHGHLLDLLGRALDQETR